MIRFLGGLLTSLLLLQPAPAALAARYSARRLGDIVRLEDSASQTVVSLIPSVGNVAFEMLVKGQNVLRWPYASVEAFRTKPGLSGIPFLGPWANRLDEQAFYANGTRYPFDMELGNVRGAIPIHGFLSTTDQWRVVEARADRQAAWVTSQLDFYRHPAWMKQFPFAHSIQITHRLEVDLTEGVAVDDEEGIGRHQIERVAWPARRSEQRVFPRIADLHAKLGSVSEDRGDRLRPMMQVDDNLADALRVQPGEDVLDERALTERHNGFRDQTGDGIEAGAKPRAENQRRQHAGIIPPARRRAWPGSRLGHSARRRGATKSGRTPARNPVRRGPARG